MSLQQINKIQEEEGLSPLLTGGFVLNFPELQYANINCKNNKAKPLCLCPTPAGEPPPLGRAGCLQSATHTLAKLENKCTASSHLKIHLNSCSRTNNLSIYSNSAVTNVTSTAAQMPAFATEYLQANMTLHPTSFWKCTFPPSSL